MLDGLVERLLDEERERERLVKQALLVKPRPKRAPRVHWIDTILDDIKDDDSDEEGSDSQKANDPCNSGGSGSIGLDSGGETDLQLRRCKSHRPPPIRPALDQNPIPKMGQSLIPLSTAAA
jgi:hypothetical protein